MDPQTNRHKTKFKHIKTNNLTPWNIFNFDLMFDNDINKYLLMELNSIFLVL